MGNRVNIKFCAWHVARAWSNNISLIHSSTKAETKKMRERARDEMKKMMWVKDRADFAKLLGKFLKDWKHQKEFMDYFKRNWGPGTKRSPMRWAKSYHPREFDSMDTNNYVESWHNQLKSVYLNRHPSDALIP